MATGKLSVTASDVSRVIQRVVRVLQVSINLSIVNTYVLLHVSVEIVMTVSIENRHSSQYSV